MLHQLVKSFRQSYHEKCCSLVKSFLSLKSFAMLLIHILPETSILPYHRLSLQIDYVFFKSKLNYMLVEYLSFLMDAKKILNECIIRKYVNVYKLSKLRLLPIIHSNFLSDFQKQESLMFSTPAKLWPMITFKQ